jgi:hypothetical protein
MADMAVTRCAACGVTVGDHDLKIFAVARDAEGEVAGLVVYHAHCVPPALKEA